MEIYETSWDITKAMHRGEFIAKFRAISEKKENFKPLNFYIKKSEKDDKPKTCRKIT